MILFYGNAVRNDEYFLQALFHSPETFFTLSGLLIPYAAAYALPLGFVVGLLLSLGRMSADKEILAMRTVGLGVGTVLYPVILLALLFSVLSVFLVGEWGPRSRALFDLRKNEIVLNSLDLILKRDGVLTFDIPPVAEEGNAQDPSAALRSLMGPEVRRCGLAAGNVEGDVWRDLRLSFRDDSDRMVGVLSARSAKVRRDTVRGVLALHLEGIDLEGDFNSSAS
ncbi:MAG: LptF/LptG family permease, partial [Opitutales bacterium]|nr:LptF/LptG family permease [Opitutales bacterium]